MSTTTFSDLKKQVASVTGLCSDEEQSQFAIKVLKYLHREGAFGLLRKWRIYADDCYITLPSDMETPKKVTVNGNPRPVQSFWHEFNDVHSFDAAEYHDHHDHYGDFHHGDGDSSIGNNHFLSTESGGIRIEPSTFATSRDIPRCGGFVYTAPIVIPGIPLYKEEDDLEIVIHGREFNTNTEVTLAHNNVLSRGEVLPLNIDKPLFSNVKYKDITNITKPRTKNRWGLFWSETLDPESQGGLLAELDQFETRASFRRAYVSQLKQVYRDFYEKEDYDPCGVCLVVLGTIRIKEYYDDNEIIPFCDTLDFDLAARALHKLVNASNSDELNVALRQKDEIEEDIRKIWDKKEAYSPPINVIDFRRRKLNKVH